MSRTPRRKGKEICVKAYRSSERKISQQTRIPDEVLNVLIRESKRKKVETGTYVYFDRKTGEYVCRNEIRYGSRHSVDLGSPTKEWADYFIIGVHVHLPYKKIRTCRDFDRKNRVNEYLAATLSLKDERGDVNTLIELVRKRKMDGLVLCTYKGIVRTMEIRRDVTVCAEVSSEELRNMKKFWKTVFGDPNPSGETYSSTDNSIMARIYKGESSGFTQRALLADRILSFRFTGRIEDDLDAVERMLGLQMASSAVVMAYYPRSDDGILMQMVNNQSLIRHPNPITTDFKVCERRSMVLLDG